MKILRILAIALPLLGIGSYFLYKKYPVNPPIKVSSSKYQGELPIQKLQLPAGFEIDVYAENVVNAREMCLSESGILYVSTRSEGKVYALKDIDGDGRAETKHILLEGGNMPNGVAYNDGDLYIAEVNRILKISNVEQKLDSPGTPEVMFDGYPTDTHHGWKFIAFGPDGRLYVPVGAPCNICKSDNKIYATITSINKDGTDLRIEQEGIRNTVGFDWHPESGELWFTDNGRDWMGDDEPECELNHATSNNQHFGFPYCHQGDKLDDEFGNGKDCNDYVPPIVKMGPHTAPLGMEFYTGKNFPNDYENDILVARHGSWNRSTKIGYDIVRISKNDSGTYTRQPFITGWLQDEKEVWGRPVDIETMADGSVLVSDDFADAIYRVYYTGK